VTDADDPVRVRRAQAKRAAATGKRLGYLCFLVAIVGFFTGLALDFPGWLVGTTIAAMAVGSVLLLPSVILGYAVNAAEREDRERGL
jgi:cytochrome c biogenesis protein ResB